MEDLFKNEWVWILGLIAVFVTLILMSLIRIRVLFTRQQQEDDNLVVNIKALFGLVRLRYEIPVIKLSLTDDLNVKTDDKSKTVETLTHKHKNITPMKIITFFKRNFKIVTNVFGFRDWLQGTLRHVKCTKIRWSTNIGLGDAPDTAVTAGIVWGLKTSLLGYVFKYIALDTRPELAVNPQFNRTQFTTELLCIVKFRLGYAIFAGLLLIVRILKVKGGIRAWQNILFKA
jgi:hypothetical protein